MKISGLVSAINWGRSLGPASNFQEIFCAHIGSYTLKFQCWILKIYKNRNLVLIFVCSRYLNNMTGQHNISVHYWLQRTYEENSVHLHCASLWITLYPSFIKETVFTTHTEVRAVLRISDLTSRSLSKLSDILAELGTFIYPSFSFEISKTRGQVLYTDL